MAEGARMRMAEPQDGRRVERTRGESEKRDRERMYVCAKERRRERGTAWSSKRQSSIPRRGAPVYPAICI